MELLAARFGDWTRVSEEMLAGVCATSKRSFDTGGAASFQQPSRWSVILASWPRATNRTRITAKDSGCAPIALTPDGLKPNTAHYFFCADCPPPTLDFPNIRHCRS